MALSRRAQVYIFAALVICVLLYSLYAESASASGVGRKYRKCAELKRELPRAVDYAVRDGWLDPDVLSVFSMKFSEYATAENEKVGFAYAVLFGGSFYGSINECSGCELIIYYSNGTASVVPNNRSYYLNSSEVSGFEIVFNGRNYSLLPESEPGVRSFCYSENRNDLQINFE